jgi:polyphosphate kinase
MSRKPPAGEIPAQVPYYNRELSWMDFNMRVLEEAMENENPVMERVRFLAITASNLDEFFMVRVAGVMDKLKSKYAGPDDPGGMTAPELFRLLSAKIHVFTGKQESCLHRFILPALEHSGIRFVAPKQMTQEQMDFVSHYFQKVLFPVLTPLAVDPSRPFPFLANRSLNIAVRLDGNDGEDCFAVVQVPSILPRFLELPGKNGRCFTLLEDVIICCLGELFEEKTIRSACPFRITRDSDLEIDEDTDDLMIEIQKSIKKRKRGIPVRLEIDRKCDPAVKDFLLEMLGVMPESVYMLNGPLDLTFFSKFANLPGCEALCFQPIVPVDPPADFWGCTDIFEAIRQKDRMVHHPYESFETVINFIRTAAEDENVLAIKQTLYRVGGHSPIVAALVKAAENGKQVTVLVELKARFDEENNILWAKKLEDAGCHVVYGLTGLKTHCKIALVVRREEDGIRRYLHMSTGNYNDTTAKLYTDIGMFTCREPLGVDASNLFNVLTGYSRPPEYNGFVVAPHDMRNFFETMIRYEIQNAKQGLPSGITAKINSLVDPSIIALLYEASGAGVPVRLVVRGICCLVPGLPGVSENIEVISIVGQLLEHSRIFVFCNAGSPKVYLGSADWMPRNLDRRVELVFPVDDPDLRQRLFDTLDLMFRDNVNARRMLPTKAYVHVDRKGTPSCNSQTELSRLAHEAVRALATQERAKPLDRPQE